MTKNSRLKFARERSGLSQLELAAKLPLNSAGKPVNQSYIAQLEGGKGYSLKQAKEFAKILNVSPEWLYFDDYIDNKSVIKVNQPEGEHKQKSNTVIIGEINSPDDESSFFDIGNGQYIMVVPVVPIKAQAGYIKNYQDEQYINENFNQKHSFAVSRVYRGKYMAFIIDGDSMDNGIAGEAILEGSTVTGREISKAHWRNKFHIHRFKDYVIVHQDGIFTKRITEHDTEKGVITCHSLNPNKDLYPDFELKLDECLQIFNIVNVTDPR